MRRSIKRYLGAGVAGVLLAACGGGGGQQGGATPRTYTGALTFANFQPFTGADASFGPEMIAGCIVAVQLINDSGGILGHQAKCTTVDTRGDPADAVPAADKMVATSTNLVGILGPSSDEATATIPIINRAQIPMFVDTGQALFDKSSYQYFWRITPPDDAAGYAMALYAIRKGFTRGAAVFGNDISSQGNVPTLLTGFKKLGGKIVLNQKYALDQGSYRSEVTQLIAANPQVIFTEADPQSSATYFSEVQQLHGSLYPIIGTEPTLNPDWLKAVSGAVGGAKLSGIYAGVQPYAPASGPAWAAYNTQLMAMASQIPNPSQWSSDPYTMTYYDGINIMALAMIAAKTPDPVFYNPYIVKVTKATPGAVVVHTFAAGRTALLAGKTIQYVGAGGTVSFDQWHNSPGGFEVANYKPDGSTNLTAVLSAADLAKLHGG